jgi:hypothetical protein
MVGGTANTSIRDPVMKKARVGLGFQLSVSGVDPGFQVGGGDTLKKIVPSGVRRESFWGISCEKSQFYAKKIIFFPILGGLT